MAERRARIDHRVGLASLFVGILSLAFSLQQNEAGATVFWAAIGLAFLVPVAMSKLSLPRLVRRRPDPMLVATACRQVANAIDALWTKRRDWRGHYSGQPGPSKYEWEIETMRLYEEGLRPWATDVAKEAIACNALAVSVRSLVRSPSPDQLPTLGDLFREAADTLERTAAAP
jgi:hypothetical protein